MWLAVFSLVLASFSLGFSLANYINNKLNKN
ncbi:MAG: hypothetical protein NSGCLCUN01_03913 [uncultured Clostridium sp.]